MFVCVCLPVQYSKRNRYAWWASHFFDTHIENSRPNFLEQILNEKKKSRRHTHIEMRNWKTTTNENVYQVGTKDQTQNKLSEYNKFDGKNDGINYISETFSFPSPSYGIVSFTDIRRQHHLRGAICFFFTFFRILFQTSKTQKCFSSGQTQY